MKGYTRGKNTKKVFNFDRNTGMLSQATAILLSYASVQGGKARKNINQHMSRELRKIYPRGNTYLKMLKLGFKG